MHLSVDCRNGVHNEDIDIDNASADLVISWIKKLDGNCHTLINIKRSDESCLMVGGGPLWYIVIFDDGRKNLTLKNDDGLEGELIKLCAGGQYGEYPGSLCVDQNQVTQAVTLFFEGNESHAAWA
jgi:hypothetical protein